MIFRPFHRPRLIRDRNPVEASLLGSIWLYYVIFHNVICVISLSRSSVQWEWMFVQLSVPPSVTIFCFVTAIWEHGQAIRNCYATFWVARNMFRGLRDQVRPICGRIVRFANMLSLISLHRVPWRLWHPITHSADLHTSSFTDNPKSQRAIMPARSFMVIWDLLELRPFHVHRFLFDRIQLRNIIQNPTIFSKHLLLYIR